MIIELGEGPAVLLSSVTWFLTSMVIGWRAARLPVERLRDEGPLTRLRSWERHGDWWHRRLRVRRWKDRLPEAGDFFRGGVSKRHLPSRTPAGLDRFRAETLRAERVHWASMATTPVHAVWCPPAVLAGMVAFGVLVNAPFIVVQRSNRVRVERILARQRADRSA